MSTTTRRKASMHRIGAAVIVVMVSALALAVDVGTHARAALAHSPDEFTLTEVISGLTRPTAVEMAPNGDVFVIEKDGRLKAFDGIDDPTADIVVDWRWRTMNTGDFGMLGLAVDPDYGSGRNYVYVHYTLDDLPGTNDPPHWNDSCSDPDGCPVTATIARIEVDPDTNTFVGSTDLLTGAVCFQFASHSTNDLAFGPDGYLYAATGDGASFVVADYGQLGNYCEDPPHPAEPTPANAQGGALRSMDLLTSVGGETNDPVTYTGTIIRIDPDTGAAAPGNPLIGVGVNGDDRIIAHGLRNPYRFAFRDRTDELWVGDVGWLGHEELNRVADVNDGVVENFGWPCFEGPSPQPIYAEYGLCQTLVDNPGSLDLATTLTGPYFSYAHPSTVAGCPGPSSALAAVAFSSGAPYPAEYDGALFMADYARQCLLAMIPDGSGVPDPGDIELLATGVVIVDLDRANDGSLLTVEPGNFSTGNGRIRRLEYIGVNQRPTAVIEADPLSGIEGETEFVLDGSASTDPEGGALTYEWDVDGDDVIDATGVTTTVIYPDAGSYPATLRVTDPDGLSDETTVVLDVSNTAPVVTIDEPVAATSWAVGDRIDFSATASDAEDGPLAPDTPGQEWEWLLILHHCPGEDCHQHIEGSWTGVDAGSFVAPDHEYPSWLELRVSVSDSVGGVAEVGVALQPRTSTITLQTDPPGLEVAGGVTASAEPAPVSIEAIENGDISVVAPSPQVKDGVNWFFGSWSDGGDRSHDVLVPVDDTTLTAVFTSGDDGSDEAFVDRWQFPTPAPGWSYWWNENGPLGDPSGYTELQWSGLVYDADGILGHPAQGQFPYGQVAAWSVHPGRGASQGAPVERHAIIRYEAPRKGGYRITASSVADRHCTSAGVEVTVLVNNEIHSSTSHVGTDPGSFDQDLGNLAAGDHIEVAVGPEGSDVCDGTSLDFTVAFVPPTSTDEIVADYREDFAEGSPSAGWSYLWNAATAIGDSTGYQPLQWNGVSYDSDGAQAGPSSDEFAYGNFASWGGHPGRSAIQATGTDRYAIARYTVSDSGLYDLIESSVVERGCASDDVEIQVRVNDTLVLGSTFTAPIGGTFDTPLGRLDPGDTVDVALGPGAYDYCDAVDLDFSLAYEVAVAGPVTSFESSLGSGEPADGWSFWWNAGGSVGDETGYQQLLWNGSAYDADGVPGYPSPDELAYGRVFRSGVHPGRSQRQGAAEDRFVIPRYEVGDAGHYAISDSAVADIGCLSDGVEVLVQVDGATVNSLIHTGTEPGAFDVDLGNLAAGTAIDIAIGPGQYDYCDAVSLAYTITRS